MGGVPSERELPQKKTIEWHIGRRVKFQSGSIEKDSLPLMNSWSGIITEFIAHYGLNSGRSLRRRSFWSELLYF